MHLFFCLLSSGSKTIAPNPKLTLRQTLTRNGGQFSSGGNCPHTLSSDFNYYLKKNLRGKVFKNGPGKIFKRLTSTNFTWFIPEYAVPHVNKNYFKFIKN